MEFLVFVFIIVFAVGFIVYSVDWMVHLSMTRDDSNINGWSSFKKFKIEFGKYDWQLCNIDADRSVKNNVNDCRFHANIIKFNGIGMKLLTPIDLILAKKFVKRWIKSNYPNQENNKRYKW